MDVDRQDVIKSPQTRTVVGGRHRVADRDQEILAFPSSRDGTLSLDGKSNVNRNSQLTTQTFRSLLVLETDEGIRVVYRGLYKMTYFEDLL